MKILIRSVLVAMAAVIAVAGTAGAAVSADAVTSSCTHDLGSRVISGSVVVRSNDPGETLSLSLRGVSADGSEVLLQTFGPIKLDPTMRRYDFSFANVDVTKTSYTLTLDPIGVNAPAVIDAEAECMPPGVPEASLPIILLSGGLIAVLFVMPLRRRTTA